MRARRSLSSSALRGGSKIIGKTEQEPMAALGNVVDAMLVFALGILLALIANWNVDLNSVDVTGIKQVEGDVQEVQQGINEDSGEYAEMGTVYRDKETGTLYIVED